MGVAADEDLRAVGFDQAQCAVVVAAGVTADVGHQDAHSVLLEKVHHRVVVPYVVAVAVAIDADERLEGGNLLRHRPGAEVAGVPDDIDRFEELAQFLVEIPVRV